MCLAVVYGPMFVPMFPNPLTDLGECLVGGGSFREGEGPSETWRSMSPASPAYNCQEGLMPSYVSGSLKDSRKPSKETWRIDIRGADFTSGAVAPASLPASCLLWVFTAMHICSGCFNSVFYKYHLSRLPISSWSVKSLPEFGLCPSFPGSNSCCPKSGLTGLVSK